MKHGGLVKGALAARRIGMVAVEVPRKDANAEKWLAENRLEVVRRFASKSGDAVVVAVLGETQASPVTAERSRSNTGPTE